MAKVGAPRQPVGTSIPSGARNASGATTTATRPRNIGGSADPAIMDAGSRSPMMAERLGAHYAITAKVAPPVLPEAAPTRAGGRLMAPKTVRSGFKETSGGW